MPKGKLPISIKGIVLRKSNSYAEVLLLKNDRTRIGSIDDGVSSGKGLLDGVANLQPIAVRAHLAELVKKVLKHSINPKRSL